jgi:chemotaxis protein methyltransferase CheR
MDTQLQTKKPPAPPATPSITPENYAYLQGQIYKDSGIVLDETKLYLIESRLLPIAQKNRLSGLNDLCALLKRPEGVVVRKQVVEAMTTNETLFFRDVGVFDALQKTILPELIEARKATRMLSFWSAAASSGQEAYSLAIMLLEMGLPGWKIRIVGTDLNNQILDRARSGRYLQIEVNRGLPVKYLVKYFQRAGLEWQLKDEVRRMVEFQVFDLRMSMRALGPFDLIFCRNVLIYFDTTTKKQILAELRGALYKKGLLLLGSAESTINLDDQFSRKVVGQATFYQAP